METLRRSNHLQEFFNQNHDPKNGRFTSGKGFGGVSADPLHRTGPLRQTDIRTLNENERRLLARRMYETTLPGNHRSVVDREETYSADTAMYYVSGHIQNASGRNVGFFERVLYQDEAGKLVVNHETFTLDGDRQSMGIGAAFNAHAIAKYREHEVDRVETYAGYEVGGYAWAREGFRIQSSDQGRHERIAEFAQLAHTHVNDAERDNRYTKEDARSMRSTIDKLVSASARGEDVQPIHITTLGYDAPHWKMRDAYDREYDTWVGKEAMLGTHWPGVYYFDYGSKAVAGSVLYLDRIEEFYNKNHDPRNGRFTSAPGGLSAGRGKPAATGTSGDVGATKRKASQFGSDILAEMNDDPHLRSLSRSEVQRQAKEWLDNSEQIRKQKMEDYFGPTGNKRPQYEIRLSMAYFDVAPEAKNLYDQISAAKLNYQNVRRSDYVPQNEGERVLQDLLRKRMDQIDNLAPVRAEGLPAGVGLQIEAIGTRLRPLGAAMAAQSVIVTAEHEAAVNHIGRKINAEIERRFNDRFNEQAEERKWTEKFDVIKRKIAEHYPDLNLERNMTLDSFGGKARVSLYGVVKDSSDREKYQRVVAEVSAMAEELGVTSDNWERTKVSARNRIQMDTIREVLSEIRNLGGSIDGTPRHRTNKYGLSSNEQVTRAGSWYPSEWIERSNERGPLNFKQTKGRAHYNDTDAVITLDGTVNTAVHELAHRMEYTVPGVRQLEKQFYDRRTAGETLKGLGRGYSKSEMTREDQFFNRYAGKSYNERAYEILSMGYEHLRSYEGWNKIDPDYRAFVLGTIAAVER